MTFIWFHDKSGVFHKVEVNKDYGFGFDKDDIQFSFSDTTKNYSWVIVSPIKIENNKKVVLTSPQAKESALVVNPNEGDNYLELKII